MFESSLIWMIETCFERWRERGLLGTNGAKNVVWFIFTLNFFFRWRRRNPIWLWWFRLFGLFVFWTKWKALVHLCIKFFRHRKANRFWFFILYERIMIFCDSFWWSELKTRHCTAFLELVWLIETKSVFNFWNTIRWIPRLWATHIKKHFFWLIKNKL